MHRIAPLTLLALAAIACAPAPDPSAAGAPAPDAAIARLLGEGIEHAHQRLGAKYAFQPYALVLNKGGAIEQLGGHSGDELDKQNPDRLFRDPTKVLADLQQQVAKEVKTGNDVVAVGFFSDVYIKLPNGSDSRAIQADLEGAAGGCETVYEPYGWVDVDSLAFGAQIKARRKGTIFPCP